MTILFFMTFCLHFFPFKFPFINFLLHQCSLHYCLVFLAIISLHDYLSFIFFSLSISLSLSLSLSTSSIHFSQYPSFTFLSFIRCLQFPYFYLSLSFHIFSLFSFIPSLHFNLSFFRIFFPYSQLLFFPLFLFLSNKQSVFLLFHLSL